MTGEPCTMCDGTGYYMQGKYDGRKHWAKCPKCNQGVPPIPERDNLDETQEDADWLKRTPVPDERFDGDDYVDKRDRPRLGKQLRAVYEFMKDGRWYTIAEVTEATGYPQQSIARQIRYLRAERFGGHTVEKRHRGDASGGLYEYRLTVNIEPEGGAT